MSTPLGIGSYVPDPAFTTTVADHRTVFRGGVSRDLEAHAGDIFFRAPFLSNCMIGMQPQAQVSGEMRSSYTMN